MSKIIISSTLLLLFGFISNAQVTANSASDTSSYFSNHPFLWGAASASYQVEGAYQADGKGQSNWDVWLNQY